MNWMSCDNMKLPKMIKKKKIKLTTYGSEIKKAINTKRRKYKV